MTTFTLDASGEIIVVGRPHGPWTGRRFSWSDLNPFTQGYVEALFGGLEHPGYIDVEPGNSDAGHVPVGFRHLAPETLARIMEDCRSALETRLWGNSAGDGRLFWSERGSEAFSGFFGGRQNELRERFPPLAPFLGDDGEVYLREDSK